MLSIGPPVWAEALGRGSTLFRESMRIYTTVYIYATKKLGK